MQRWIGVRFAAAAALVLSAAGRAAAADAHSSPAPARKDEAVNPCLTPDPGFGKYDAWKPMGSIGHVLAPKDGGVTETGAIDVLVHFHGREPIRKEFVKAADGIVLVGVDLGIGSGAYSKPFSSPDVFPRLLDNVKREMARRSGRKSVAIRHLGLSAWSAGYGAIQEILKQPSSRRVDAVVLLDALHGGYQEPGHTVSPFGLEPFVAFARKATHGRKFFFHTYSSIIPPGYASTREIARFIAAQVNADVKQARRSDVLGLAMDERSDLRDFHSRGYRGNDRPDHCAHLGLMKDIVEVHLNERWHPPSATRTASSPTRLQGTRDEVSANARAGRPVGTQTID